MQGRSLKSLYVLAFRKPIARRLSKRTAARHSLRPQPCGCASGLFSDRTVRHCWDGSNVVAHEVDIVCGASGSVIQFQTVPALGSGRTSDIGAEAFSETWCRNRIRLVICDTQNTR